MPKKPDRRGRRITAKRRELYAAMRVDHEVHGLGSHRLSKKYRVPANTIDGRIKAEGWVRFNPKAKEHIPSMEPPGVTPAMPRPGDTENELLTEVFQEMAGGEELPPENPETRPPDPGPRLAFSADPEAPRPEKKRARSSSHLRADNVIKFPGVMLPPMATRMVGVAPDLPQYTPEQKQQIRVTMGAIRASMTLEQVQMLEHHEGLLRRYAWLLECYLDPTPKLDLDGLSADEAGEKIAMMQGVAMRQLLPTERDTLAGVFKQLTDSLMKTIEMKRKIAGLASTKAGASNLGVDDGEEVDGKMVRAVNGASPMTNLSTKDLRLVSDAMELMHRRHLQAQDAPKPPPPDSIDDLMDPDPDEDPE